jgi:hypothetical protein
MTDDEKLMKKLTFAIRIGGEAGKGGSEPQSITFIYGIGTGGLSDFEKAVSRLKPGDSIRLDLPSDDLRGYLGPLSCLLGPQMAAIESAKPRALECKLTAIGAAEPREVVTAIAQMQKAGGCASGCACGCGGH